MPRRGGSTGRSGKGRWASNCRRGASRDAELNGMENHKMAVRYRQVETMACHGFEDDTVIWALCYCGLAQQLVEHI